ncbi:MAG: pseudouridine-5'-phosphate glycosidase [Candidatus Sericytochromatia bacterium]|nr:pseudouridine-5'-phosphate glycosidase [Candidatus Sericytochromatia bacterium]
MSSSNFLNEYLNFSPEVKSALKNNLPIVALESTIISHGMPYPLNVKTAREVEEIIKNKGATPATIGIINGKIKIGLTSDELEYFGSAKDIEKVSRRDLPYIISSKKNGATTVAGTMICANLANLKVFVTGGIGGVHRGVLDTWDISADLNELMNTSIAVICAGVKSILDIDKTLEYLETSGVPIIGYQTNDFPAFYTIKSGSKVDYRIDSSQEIAEFLKVKWDLGLKGGVIIANPVPEKDAMDEDIINQAIISALNEASEQQIKGKNITPFLLGKIKQITSGKSLETNISLIKNNALLGAKIAISLSK